MGADGQAPPQILAVRTLIYAHSHPERPRVAFPSRALSGVTFVSFDDSFLLPASRPVLR